MPMTTLIQVKEPEGNPPALAGKWVGILELFREDLDRVARRGLGSDLASKVDACDVVQETMLRAVRKLDRFRGQTAEELGGWLRSILASSLSDARRHHRDAARRRVEREVSIEVIADPASDITSPSRVAIQSEREAAIVVALLKLPERDRRVVSLRYREGLTFCQVGDQLGISSEAARKVCDRAIQRLRQALGAEHDPF